MSAFWSPMPTRTPPGSSGAAGAGTSGAGWPRRAGGSGGGDAGGATGASASAAAAASSATAASSAPADRARTPHQPPVRTVSSGVQGGAQQHSRRSGSSPVFVELVDGAGRDEDAVARRHVEALVAEAHVPGCPEVMK